MKKLNITAYDRKEAEKMIAQGYRYIARDKDQQLFLYYYKPRKLAEKWWIEAGRAYYISASNFRFIEWENEEPTLIADILRGGKK